jgi:3-methyladenine DNA glycosylase Tag
MAINELRAQKLAQQAFDHLKENDPDTLAWARNVGTTTFRNLRPKAFLSEYCWVVYASGFKFAIIQEKFPSLQKAFKDFDPAALSRMRSIKAVLTVFNNEKKANCFLSGAQTVIEEGFSHFKRRLLKEGV